ncbi:MFS transporter [Rhodococcus sp. USK13]|uniref:MFS transporter n=1 Tax=Rhodococcus sp. USK13 TaxID=2806442 RepID=UPI001BCB6128|nr:MFS transporter [Rhodococcus sp. USK13]
MSSSIPGTVRPTTEFRTGWKALTAATVGIGTGVAVLPFYTNGLFIPELEAEFGWSRSQLSLLQLVGSTITVATAPLVGLLVDRVGVRVPATVSLIALGLSYCALSKTGSSFLAFLSVWALMYILAAASTAVAFTRPVNERFYKSRGLALGIALSGAGIAAVVVPKLLGSTIDEDWRLSYKIIGGTVLAGAVLVLLLMPSNRRMNTPRILTADTGIVDLLRGQLFWRLSLAFLFLALAVGGMTVHFVPMLRDAGVSSASAASTAALVGITVIVGRIVVGMLVDRLFAPYVAAGVICLSAAGFALLLLGGPSFAAAAALAIGFALGAEVDLIGYLTSRYFGLENYGRIFGIFYGIFTLALGISPLVIAEIHSLTQSYSLPLLAGIVLMLAAASLLGTAPRFCDEKPIPDSVNDVVVPTRD